MPRPRKFGEPPLPLRLNGEKTMSTRLLLSFNRARVLEGIALIVFASLIFAFVHSVVPYLAD